jgi:hypothetical protein
MNKGTKLYTAQNKCNTQLHATGQICKQIMCIIQNVWLNKDRLLLRYSRFIQTAPSFPRQKKKNPKRKRPNI